MNKLESLFYRLVRRNKQECLFYYNEVKVIQENIIITRLKQLPIEDIQPLLWESKEQGFDFLQWLVNDYASGKNQFALPGEALFAAYNGLDMVAIGGLNLDPYRQEATTGRVRRVYVLSDWRRQGIGRRLVQRIIEEARLNFRLLTLRTRDEPADRFYRALGFQTQPPIEGATHYLYLK